MKWLWLIAVVAAPALGDGRRFALVIGENRGLQNEELLRFAIRDAHRVRDALVDVGGFAPNEVWTLAGADATSVRANLTQLRHDLATGVNDRLFVYVSSHSGEGALHLAGTELPLQELVDFVKSAPVAVGVLVVDACQSGRVTRMKGLKPVGPSAPRNRIEASGVEGRVLISASGADEFAQESDALEGSYFTHYLVAGLRGAADSSRDGQITLDEVYGWAWARTIEATFSSQAGVQRPAFSVDLRGAGQLVLAEPGRSPAQLIIGVQAPGRWLVVAENTGALYADVAKGEGPLTFAVPGGVYRVQLRLADAVLERRVVVPPQGAVTVSGEDLERTSLLRVARKGGEEAMYVVSGAGGLTSGLVAGLSAEPQGELRLRRDSFLVGIINQLSATFAVRGGSPASGSFTHLELELRIGAGHRFAWSGGSLAVGVDLGGLLVLQDALPDASSRTSLGLTTSLALEGRIHLFGPVDLVLLGTGGGAIVKRLEGISLVPRLGVSAGVAVGF